MNIYAIEINAAVIWWWFRWFENWCNYDRRGDDGFSTSIGLKYVLFAGRSLCWAIIQQVILRHKLDETKSVNVCGYVWSNYQSSAIIRRWGKDERCVGREGHADLLKVTNLMYAHVLIILNVLNIYIILCKIWSKPIIF